MTGEKGEQAWETRKTKLSATRSMGWPSGSVTPQLLV